MRRNSIKPKTISRKNETSSTDKKKIKQKKIIDGVSKVNNTKSPKFSAIKTETQFRLLIENSKDMLALIDKNLTIIYLSPSIEKQTGWKIGSLIGNQTIDFIHPNDRKILSETLKKVITKFGNTFQHEIRFRKTNGKYIWVESIFTNYLNIDGVNAIAINFRDINEKKLSEIILKTIVENSQNLIILKDENENIVFVSPQCKKVLGFSYDDYKGKKMQFNIYPEDLERYHQKWENIKTKGKDILNHEYRLIDEDGSIRWLSHSVKKIFIDGNIKRYQSSIRNITEQKILEELLKENEYLLKTSQEVSIIGSYVVDMSARKWRASKVLNSIFGLPEKVEHTDEEWISVIHPDHQQTINNNLKNEAIVKQQRFEKEYKIINKKTKAIIWVHDIGEIIPDENGNINKMYGTIQDITIRKNAEEIIANKTREIMRFNKIMVGREIKMIELKKEINELLKKYGNEEKYKIEE